jgi:penicillin amidase
MKWFIVFILTGLYPVFSCEYFRDDKEIVHFKAQDKNQYYYCLGFLHASDRLAQMLYFRKIIDGTSAEISGANNIKIDFAMRALNFRIEAQRILKELNENEVKHYLEIYSLGVNKAMENAKPYELNQFDVELIPWKPEDSIAFILLQSFDQTKKTFLQEISRSSWQDQYKEKTQDLFSLYGTPWESSILESGEYKTKNTNSNYVPKIHKNIETDIFDQSITGSNSWVVNAKKGNQKYAVLANDPHLELRYPPFWYWSAAKVDSLDLAGASFPGIPFIASGLNNFVSWGMTNSYFDTADLIEVDPKDEIISERPIIWFKWWKIKLPYFFKKIEKTKTGLWIYPSSKDGSLGLKWSGNYLSAKDFQGIFNLNFSKSLDQANFNLEHIGVPSWNYVIADTSGDIGYKVVGKLPNRNADNSWNNFLDPKDNPGVLRPKRGFVITANNHHWGKDAQFSGGENYAEDFRHHRISVLMKLYSQDKNLSLEDHQAIQCDTQAADAPFFVPLLLKRMVEQQMKVPYDFAFKELETWDFETNLDCKACVYYRIIMRELMKEYNVNEIALYRLLDKNEIQLKNSLSSLKNDNKTWGDVHQIFFRHIWRETGMDPLIGLASKGDEHSVNPGTMKIKDQFFEQTHGASQRSVILMKKNPEWYLTMSGPNLDLDRKDLSHKNYNEWNKCQYTKIEFPLNDKLERAWQKINLPVFAPEI